MHQEKGPVFASCFGKDDCFCSAWALGRVALMQAGFFFLLFFLAGFGIVITRPMVNVKAICKMGFRPVY